jgi:hypothetical protein
MPRAANAPPPIAPDANVPAAPEAPTTTEPAVDKPHAPAFVPHPAMAMNVPSPERLAKSSQRVILHNTSDMQTHIVIDRFNCGQELKPGERREVEMIVDEIENLRFLARTDRGTYPSGPKAGLPFPAHPVRVIDIPA